MDVRTDFSLASHLSLIKSCFFSVSFLWTFRRRRSWTNNNSEGHERFIWFLMKKTDSHSARLAQSGNKMVQLWRTRHRYSNQNAETTISLLESPALFIVFLFILLCLLCFLWNWTPMHSRTSIHRDQLRGATESSIVTSTPKERSSLSKLSRNFIFP